MRTRRNRGFNLIELMVVITIIAMLAGGVAIALFGALEDARQAKAKDDVVELDKAIQFYRMKAHKLPDTLEDLTKTIEGQSEPYLREVSKDPWGKEYDYQKREGSYIVRSFGADGVEGGEGKDADISNQPEKKN